MDWLFDQLRPKIDETSLHDDANFADGAEPPKPVRWRVVALGSVLIIVGLLFLCGMVMIGARVDWVLTDTIPWRRSEIWAGAAMGFICLVGLFLSYAGWSLIRASRGSRSR